jgi:hypothetical protein
MTSSFNSFFANHTHFARALVVNQNTSMMSMVIGGAPLFNWTVSPAFNCLSGMVSLGHDLTS